MINQFIQISKHRKQEGATRHMTNLLLADGSDEFRAALSQALTEHFHVCCCKTGKEALEQALLSPPDIMVLDLMLPELDGLSLLSALHTAQTYPVVLATTRLLSDYIVEQATRLNVGYLMVKPCDVTATVQRVLDLRDAGLPRVEENPRVLISKALLDLGISTKLKGFSYLQEAVLLMAQNPDISITKELYPVVGNICHSRSALVERSIRSAVDGAWRNRNDAVWLNYFRADASGLIPRPSNTLFISRLAGSLRDKTR